MNDLPRTPSRFTTERPICVAVMAMGGQGGGVLCDWIVELAESQGWHAQSTSIPGVAQRTGATLYYVEMLPPKGGRAPILSLMPAQGEVDVVLASELMEAGRSILRGLVTPERTTLIASTHRLYAVAEKEKPGDATADPNTVVEAAGVAAKRMIAFDMEAVANSNNSVISACLFGALAASGTLPFTRESFEAIIKSGGRGVATNLNAFRAAHEQAAQPPAAKSPTLKKPGKRFTPLPASATVFGSAVASPGFSFSATAYRRWVEAIKVVRSGVTRPCWIERPASISSAASTTSTSPWAGISDRIGVRPSLGGSIST